MSQHEPRTLIKSREVLQSLKGGHALKRYQQLDVWLTEIWMGVKAEAVAGNTKYIYNFAKISHTLNPFEGWEPIDVFRMRMINILEKEYPNCKIDYNETKGYDSKVIEQLIVIDWS